jgi:RNase P/RNase MRP subunit POP5
VKGTRRQRYISFQIIYENTGPAITQSELIQTLRQRSYEGFSKTTKELGLWVIQFNGTTGILKCHHREKENMIQFLKSLQNIGKKQVTITTHATSGTIQGLTVKKRKQND